jgi:putative proteasome-type protease
MTFCLGITVDEGLIAISDTRLVAGNECLVGRKTASYQGPDFAFFVMHSGLRSLRDKALLYFEEAFARESTSRDRLYRVVNLYAQQVRRVAIEDAEALDRAELKFNLHSLIGGQMTGDSAHRLFLVYPEGNWVEIGPDTPYQIIGASGFGKPILERSLNRTDSMLYAFKVGLLAFDATRLCAADVSFPVDVTLYSRGSFTLVEQRYKADDLREISNWWQERMRSAVHDLPSGWVEAAFSRLTRSELVL